MLWTIFLIHCVLSLSVAQSELENLDTLQPIVRSSPEMGQFADDLFGYTTVLHKMREEDGLQDTLIVVSAPYGQAIPRSGETLRIQRGGPTMLATGVIYTCPLTPGPCEGLRGDNNGDDRRLYDLDGNIRVSQISDSNFGEEKRGQFLGATLKSTGDNFLACAHRRLDFGAGLDRNPYGVCYISGRSLSGFTSYAPCNRASRSFFGHGQCQAGTSGDIINGNILLGAPGTFAWRGAVFRRSSAGITSSSSNGVGSGSISWQGYEVVTGRINSAQNLDFIVSVPRFNNYIGRVNIYAATGQLRPVGNPPLAGDQIGAYYGFSMAAVDLQGLGMDDLLISAPLFSSEVNTPEYGRVYVYRNNQGALSLFTTLEGSIRYGRFGHAMAKLGDINGDSFEDVAISAPFGDGDGDGVPGRVYIYAGAGSTSVINQNPIQTIIGSTSGLNLPASELTGLMSFGSSLSSNVDVDNNGYNDLVIGAFRSQKVFMLRTRPVARLEVTLDSASAVDLRVTTMEGCGGQSCFNISVSVMYGGRGLQNTLDINYTLEVDPLLVQRGLASRVALLNENSPGRIVGNLTLTANTPMQVNATAIVQPQIDISSPFTVRFTPGLIQTRTRDPNWNGNMVLTPLETSPLLSVVGETSALTQYVTACGNNSICQPNLQVTVMMDNITYENEDGNVIPGATGIVSGITTAMEIPVFVVNNGDDAFGARITVTFESVLTLSRVVPPVMDNMPRIPFTCSDRDVDTNSVSCAIANEFLSNASRIIIFRFQTNAVTGAEMGLEIIFNVTSQPSENETTSADNAARVNISIEANVDLRLQLSLTQESIVLGETNPGGISDVAQFAPPSSIFNAIFSITNLGSTRVPFAQLSIFWPLDAPVDCDDRSTDEDCRFYLYPIQTDDGLSCESTYINTLNRELELLGEATTQSPGGSKRKRRQAVAEVADVTEVSCINGGATGCVEILCNITDISRTARVSIQAIPDNRQFFGTVGTFQFIIHARVVIVGEFQDRNITDNEDMATLVGIPVIAPSSSQDDDIPAWVIIVPIIIGVLIIIVIVIALYFLGFFKLKKVDKEKDEEELNQDGDAPDGDKQPEASEL